MAEDLIETFRLSLMQDVLPVGMAIVDRARKGGVTKIAEAFIDSDDPLEALRDEGEPAAKTFRPQLDNLSPGLGNPVVPVKVAVDENDSNFDQTRDQESLMQVLQRIQVGMEELEKHLFNDCADDSTITID